LVGKNSKLMDGRFEEVIQKFLELHVADPERQARWSAA